MKRKYAALVLGMALSLTCMNLAYASDTETTEVSDTAETTDSTDAADDTSAEAEDEEAIYGEVTEIGTDSITIDVGTLKQDQTPPDAPAGDGDTAAEDTDIAAEDEDTDTDDDAGDTASDSAADETDSDAAETDSASGMEDGAPEDGGEAPSMLELTGESETITLTDTTTYEKQAAPEMPAEGEAPEDNTDAEAEDSASDSTEDTADTASDTTEDTDADAAEDTVSDGDEAPADPGEMPEMEMETETIELDDIEVGDTVMITLDEDGNAKTVTVMNSMGEAPDGEAPASDEESADSETDTVSDTAEDEATDTEETEEE